MAVGEGTITEQVRTDVTDEAEKTTSGFIAWQGFQKSVCQDDKELLMRRTLIFLRCSGVSVLWKSRLIVGDVVLELVSLNPEGNHRILTLYSKKDGTGAYDHGIQWSAIKKPLA